MTDKPILMAGPMALATWEGRKTVTRRVVKEASLIDADCTDEVRPFGDGSYYVCARDGTYMNGQFRPPYAPGDRLWVRETWAVSTVYDGTPPREINPGGKPNWCGIRYAATDERLGIKDRPSIHMPRWASRMTLTVTDVRAERLLSITEEDARAEGPDLDRGDGRLHPLYRLAFANLWDSLAKPGARWDDNPWVWRIAFTAERRNIDARLAA